MQACAGALRKTALATGVVAVAALGVLAPGDLTSADRAIRDGFRAALGEMRNGWPYAGEGSLSLAADHGREARLWLGSGTADTAPALTARSLRVGERITIRGSEGQLATFDVRSVAPIDGAVVGSARPMLVVVLQPAANPAASPVRLIVEADEAAPGRSAAASPRTL